MLDIRKFNYFLAICRAGSLTGAAQELRIAQSALSHHLSQMEAEYGVKLLERHARGVTPTDAGQLLQARAERIVRELSHTEELLREHSNTPTGDIVVGIISSLAVTLTGPLLDVVSEHLPRVRLFIKEGDSRSISRGLQENRIDLAISLSGAIAPSSRALADEPLYLVSNREQSPDTDEISLLDALALPLVLPTRDHVIRTVVEGAASQLAARANVAWEINGNATVRSAVLGGYGHTILGRASFERDFSGDFRTCRIVRPELFRRIVLQSSDIAINQVAVKRITEAVIDITETLIEGGIWVPVRQ